MKTTSYYHLCNILQGYINKYSKSIILQPLDVPPTSSSTGKVDKSELEKEIKRLKDINSELSTKCKDLTEKAQVLESNVKVTQKLYAEATQTANEYSLKLESALEERDDAVLTMESMQEQLDMLKLALDSMTSSTATTT